VRLSRQCSRTRVVMSSSESLDRGEGGRAVPLLAEWNRILEMIAKNALLEDILTSVARLAESQVEGMLCSILLLDGEGRLRHGAAPSLPEAYFKAIDGVLIGPKVGSCGTAAYRREPVIATDLLADPLWEDYRDLATRHGLRACWSTPFFSRQGNVLGTFAMYYRTPRIPASAETQLLGVATHVASIVVERWQSDREIRRAAETYRGLVENLNDIVFSLDVAGNLSYVSPRIEQLSGFRANEIIGKSFSQFVYPDDLGGLQKSFVNTLAGHLAPHEFRVADGKGRLRWCRSSSRPQFHGGKLVGLAGVIVDITEHKQTEEALQKAEQKYRAIFEQAIIGIFQSDPDGRYVTANPAQARMLGYDSPEELTTSITDISHQLYVDPKRREEFTSLVEKKGSVRNFECEVYRKDGSTMWLSVNARGIVRDGRIVAFEGMNEDITDRKLLEQQLLQAQKMEAVGQLAGGIAHDFNNLLGVILGHGELLLKRLHSSDPARRRIEQICLAGQRAVSLTAQLLAFSRRQILRPVVLDLNAVVENLNNMIARSIGEDIPIVCKLDPALGRVRADAGQIEQILLNLVVNARDAMPQGGILTMETRNVEVDRGAQVHLGAKEGRYCELAVSDTGTGMDQQTMARMFEPFFTTKEPDKGTGLGLATVYGVVKQSGGYISVTSELKKGTTLRIYLPRTEEAVHTPKLRHLSSAVFARAGETILLVEDADLLRGVTREFLEGAGYRVLEAHAANVALEVAERHKAPISLMITDVVMPGMTGRNLAERLKSTRPETKVLYVSGYADETIFRHGVLPSGTDFLHKPYTQDVLISKLREVLDAAT